MDQAYLKHRKLINIQLLINKENKKSLILNSNLYLDILIFFKIYFHLKEVKNNNLPTISPQLIEGSWISGFGTLKSPGDSTYLMI